MKVDPHKVAVFYHYVAHYRSAIFEKLSQNQAYHFTIYSDAESNLPQIVTISKNTSIRWCRIRNFWIGKTLLFQPSAITNAALGEEGTIIYLGSMWHLSTWIAATLARLRGKKVLMWTHGVKKVEKNFRGTLRRLFYRLSHTLLLYGHNAEKYLKESNYPNNQLHVIYNSLNYDVQEKVRHGFSPELRCNTRQRLFQHPDYPILLTLGRMVQRVNYPLLFAASQKLHSRGFPVNILIIGDGPERKPVESLATNLKLLKYVNLYGPCHKEEELGPLINVADLMIGPGHVGLSCIHSLTYGTPVISHDDPHGELAPEFEVITCGKNGNIFRHNDSDNLADVIHSWIKTHPNREAVERACTQSIYPRFTPEYQVQEIVCAINNLHKSE